MTKANDYYGQSSTFSAISNLGFSFAGYAGSDSGSKDINQASDKYLGTKGGKVF
jgi:hypothetical protein